MLEEDVFPPEFLRRFPVYLLLDCSGTMHGEPMTAVNEGLEMIHQLLLRDAEAREIAYISVINFAQDVEMYPLVPVEEFEPPTLTAGGLTALGTAFQALLESIEHDLIVNSVSRKGDYRPIVFLLSDGKPTDSYRDVVDKVKALKRHRPAITALGCGPDVDKKVLHEITDDVYLMPEIDAGTLKKYFKWITDVLITKTHVPGATPPSASTIDGIVADTTDEDEEDDKEE